MSDMIKNTIAKTFLDIASGLETGSFAPKPKIVVTGPGSEHGEEEMLRGSVMAAAGGIDVVYIGSLTHESITTIPAANDKDAHDIMERMLESGEADGAVTMHYPFPIGVSTVGRVVTPGMGRPMYIATTTGTSSSNRVEGMIKNAIYGVVAAKACGLREPTVGILNVDGARQTEGALKELGAKGYEISFASSGRSDGGCVMRGNDLLTGVCDVLVTDPLTGNILVKTLSSFTTGGSYESVGWGYGPGIGQGYDRLVMIISRASGAPVLKGSIEYAAELVRGNYRDIAGQEFAAAEKAGLKRILESIKAKASPAQEQEAVQAPPKEVVTGEISGVEITELEDAVAVLWKAGIYAESGMGCTGPIILVNEPRLETAVGVLAKYKYITE